MKNKIVLVVLATLICHSRPSLAWVAGFGKERLVTDQDFLVEDPVYLAGYGLSGNRPAIDIHDEVTARSLYLSDGSSEVLFISLDAIGFSQVFAKQLRQALIHSIDIKPDDILLSATHTHSSIDIQGVWGSITEQQKTKLIKKVVNSAREALASQQSVILRFNQSMKGQGVNRRHKSDGITTRITSVHIETPDRKPFALLFAFGSHPVVLDKNNLRVSSDWVGFARKKLEKYYKTNTVFINGVLGDVLPLPENSQRNFRSARQYGETIARQIITSTPGKLLADQLFHCSTELQLDADNLQLIGLTKIQDQGTIDWHTSFSTSLTTRVSVLAVGSLVLLTVPGEPVTRFGRTIMDKVKNRPVAVLGLTHDSLGYLIPEDDFGLEDGKEEVFSLSRKFAGQVSSAIEQLVEQCHINKNANKEN